MQGISSPEDSRKTKLGIPKMSQSKLQAHVKDSQAANANSKNDRYLQLRKQGRESFKENRFEGSQERESFKRPFWLSSNRSQETFLREAYPLQITINTYFIDENKRSHQEHLIVLNMISQRLISFH